MPTYNPPPVPLAGLALQLAVYAYDSSADDGSSFTLLPNVQVWNIQYKEGNDPPSAHLNYILDERAVAAGREVQMVALEGQQLAGALEGRLHPVPDAAVGPREVPAPDFLRVQRRERVAAGRFTRQQRQ